MRKRTRLLGLVAVVVVVAALTFFGVTALLPRDHPSPFPPLMPPSSQLEGDPIPANDLEALRQGLRPWWAEEDLGWLRDP